MKISEALTAIELLQHLQTHARRRAADFTAKAHAPRAGSKFASHLLAARCYQEDVDALQLAIEALEEKVEASKKR